MTPAASVAVATIDPPGIPSGAVTALIAPHAGVRMRRIPGRRQATFARLVGVTPRQVNNWARGRATAPLWAVNPFTAATHRYKVATKALDIATGRYTCSAPIPIFWELQHSQMQSTLNPPSIPKGRAQLSEVLRRAGEVVSVDDVSGILHIERQAAARLLARWNGQGWVRRLRRGFYAPVPVAALGQSQVLEDPWVIVPELFGPACIGGWSAAEHWGLTEQLFRRTCVLTARPVREKEQTIEGMPFTLKHVRKEALFATRAVWRGTVKIDVSSPAKTIIDMLDDPAIGGGIRHVADCVGAYFEREDAFEDELLDYTDQLGNRAVFKRLGFLAERLPGRRALAEACRERLSRGTAKLDPSLPCMRLVTRWRLWVPPSWAPAPA